MKIPKSFSLWLLIAWVGLAIVDMWFDVIATSTFIKLSITIGLIMIIVVGISIAQRNAEDERKD